MDDLKMTITFEHLKTTLVPGHRWIVKSLESLITWALMCFKPIKSMPGSKERKDHEQISLTSWQHSERGNTSNVIKTFKMLITNADYGRNKNSISVMLLLGAQC